MSNTIARKGTTEDVTMDGKNMREAFEFFYALNWDECDVFMQKQWEAAWKASRAALVIDLTDCGADVFDGCGYLNPCKVEEAIEAAGVTVKS